MHDGGVNSAYNYVIAELLKKMLFGYFHLDLWLRKDLIIFVKIVFLFFL